MEKMTSTTKEREQDLSSTGSLTQSPDQLRLGHPEGRREELNPAFPCMWQKPSCLNHHLPSPRVCISRKLGLEPKHFDGEHRSFKQNFHRLSPSSCLTFLKSVLMSPGDVVAVTLVGARQGLSGREGEWASGCGSSSFGRSHVHPLLLKSSHRGCWEIASCHGPLVYCRPHTGCSGDPRAVSRRSLPWLPSINHHLFHFGSCLWF